MEFVKVMEIAKRFSKEHIGTLPEWFLKCFNMYRGVLQGDENEASTAERELLAWAEQHPDTKEDKLMKTKVHELLESVGMIVGKEYTIIRERDGEEMWDKVYVDDQSGVVRQFGNGLAVGQADFACIANGVWVAKGLPAYTPEQVKTMKWLVQGGFRFVVKTALDIVHLKAYSDLPEFDQQTQKWICGEGWFAISDKISCLRDAIKDWTQPLDLLAALKDAGEETEANPIGYELPQWYKNKLKAEWAERDKTMEDKSTEKVCVESEHSDDSVDGVLSGTGKSERYTNW
jgi:hypothetical protein